MDEKKGSTGKYSVENVTLVDFSFSRKENVELHVNEVQNTIDITTEIGETNQEGKLIVSVVLSVNSLQKDEQIFFIKVKMTGIFVKEGNPALSEDVFKKVNAPAIIYPFIREQVATTCLKAGLANIFLPPVNFVERNK